MQRTYALEYATPVSFTALLPNVLSKTIMADISTLFTRVLRRIENIKTNLIVMRIYNNYSLPYIFHSSLII